MPAALIDPVDATFVLAVLVLAAAVGLTVFAVVKNNEASAKVFSIIGVLLGLFGAGGLGSLFVHQAAESAADTAAEKAAPRAANAAADRVAAQAPAAKRAQRLERELEEERAR